MPRTPIPGYRWRLLAWHDSGEKKDVRHTREDRVKFDELVIDGWFHIEEMDNRHYWMQVCDRHINVVVPYNGEPYISSEWTDKPATSDMRPERDA